MEGDGSDMAAALSTQCRVNHFITAGFAKFAVCDETAKLRQAWLNSATNRVVCRVAREMAVC